MVLAYKEKRAEYWKAYYAANAERIKSQQVAGYKANAERIKERNAKWRSANKTQQAEYRNANAKKIKEYRKVYYAANADRIKEQRKAYYAANAARIKEQRAAWYKANKEQQAEYYQANKDKFRLNDARRRARKAGAEGQHTQADLDRILAEQCGCCPGCNVDLGTLPKAQVHLDHKLPLSRGGSNWSDNLQFMCQPCNDSKGARTMEEWQNADAN